MTCVFESARTAVYAPLTHHLYTQVIFQLTVRCLSGTEIADDDAVVALLKRQYDVLAETTPTTVLLPWLPTPAMVRKLRATKVVYDTVVAAVDARERGGCARDDTLQLLLDAGDDRATIIGFIMGLLVAGARATGTTASWLVVYLSAYPEWRVEAKEEILRLLATHATESATSPLQARLASIPLAAWEADTPVFDALIRETLRIAQPHTAIRKNLGPDVLVDGKLVPAGAHVVYPFSDVHLDEALYPSPWVFDPTRPARQGKMEYLGFGGGNTVCLGNRLAKMMIKLSTGMFLLAFESSVVDATGIALAEAPVPDWNDAVHARPTRPCYLEYERTKVIL
ncbi:cytochrome P450 [Schizophyllum amplum]|uniref:Cytochrome P450 n=1 Tax=Schizophyllum amplum TaxID=97359 RepID=A0A550CFI8_9AGAR|nr:cytochrome P450 [Auriculariopsis ampla]